MFENPRIEICANSAESAARAQEGGAYRVELCAGIPEGGTTPSWGEMVMARKLLSTTRMNVIIRPRGGDFLYSDAELEIMAEDIEAARRVGADGVVFGCLTAKGDVDLRAMRRLMDLTAGMDMTFHRAFDMCRDPHQALEEIIDLGCRRILTSGQQPSALEGVGLIRELVEAARGRLTIMPGCGVRPQNIREIAEKTGAEEFHFSGRSEVESGMGYRNPRVSMGGVVKIEEYRRDVTDPRIVAQAIDALR